MKNILLNYFGYNVQVISKSKKIISRIEYIFRYFLNISENQTPDITFFVNKNNKNENIELVSSNEKFTIQFTYDGKTINSWLYKDTFLPPMRVLPFKNKFLVLHGCAARKDNKTYVFLAPSMSGKTSLLFYLIYNGFKAISDDLLFIDVETGLLFPYKKPVGIRENALNIIPNLDKLLKQSINKDTLIFFNSEGKRTWLVHLDDLFHNDVYCKEKTLIDYIIIPDKNLLGEIKKMSSIETYNTLLRSLCNSGLKKELVDEYIIKIMSRTKNYYLPTQNLKDAYFNILNI